MGGFSSLAAFLTQLPWPAPERRPWEWHYAGSGRWGLLVIMLALILFWGIVIAGIAIVVRVILSLGRDKTSAEALTILKQRYARGEIDRVEYERMKRDLKG